MESTDETMRGLVVQTRCDSHIFAKYHRDCGEPLNVAHLPCQAKPLSLEPLQELHRNGLVVPGDSRVLLEEFDGSPEPPLEVMYVGRVGFTHP